MKNHKITGLLALNIFMSGAAFAAMTPYRAIVGVETLGLSNAAFGLIMALNALGGLMISVFLGWFSDRVRDRRLLVLICALAGALGFVLVWSVQTPIGFATAFCLLVPFGNALFSQSFSYSRAYYDREQPDRSELMMSFLRSGFTMAWIVIPPLAGWLAATTSAYTVFGVSALAHLGCTLATALLWTQKDSRIGLEPRNESNGTKPDLAPARISRSHRFGAMGVVFSMIALQLNMSTLPLVIIRDLGGNLAQVGITSAIAAAIEVPIMIGWGYLALRWRKESILMIASAVFAIYFALLGFAQNFTHILLLQVLAATSIAALLSINISYLQEAIPGRVGLSTSLVDISHIIAALSAAAIFALYPWANYAPLMIVAALVSLVAVGLLAFAKSLPTQAEPDQTPTPTS